MKREPFWLILLVLLAMVLPGCRPATTSNVPSAHTTGVKELAVLQGKEGAGHVSLPLMAFSPDGTMLVSASSLHVIKLWNVATLKELASIETKSPAHSAHFSPDGKTLAFGALDGRDDVKGPQASVRLWDITTKKEQKRFSPFTHDSSWGIPVAFAPDGKTLASANSFWVTLWDVAAGSEPLQLERAGKVFDKVTTHSIEGEINCLAFSPDGKILAAGDREGIRLWDATTGKLHATLVANSAVRAVSFSPDSKTLGTVCASHSPNINALLWDVTTGKQQRKLQMVGTTGSGAHAIAFAPDGHTLALGDSEGWVQLFDVATWNVRLTFRHSKEPNYLNSIALSPDGKNMATGSGDGSVRLWDVSSALAQPLKK